MVSLLSRKPFLVLFLQGALTYLLTIGVPSDWGLLEARVLFPWVSTGLHMHEQTCRDHPNSKGRLRRPRRWMGCVLRACLEASWVVLDRKHCPFHAWGSGQALSKGSYNAGASGVWHRMDLSDSSGQDPFSPLPWWQAPGPRTHPSSDLKTKPSVKVKNK